MGRIKDLILDVEMLNELEVKITFDDILSMMETENLSANEIVDELKNKSYK